MPLHAARSEEQHRLAVPRLSSPFEMDGVLERLLPTSKVLSFASPMLVTPAEPDRSEE
jgi:hypothetical protein